MISIIRSMLLLVTVCFASCNGASKAGGRTWWPSQCGNKVTNVVNGDTLTIDYRCDEDSYTMIHMKNDYYHGLFKRWDKNGILRSRIDYCRDRFCGDVIGWDTAGNILTEKKYNSSGEPIGFHRGSTLPTTPNASPTSTTKATNTAGKSSGTTTGTSKTVSFSATTPQCSEEAITITANPRCSKTTSTQPTMPSVSIQKANAPGKSRMVPGRFLYAIRLEGIVRS